MLGGGLESQQPPRFGRNSPMAGGVPSLPDSRRRNGDPGGGSGVRGCSVPVNPLTGGRKSDL